MSIQNAKWSTVPNKTLVENLKNMKSRTVLDIGGSDGVNAVFLAANGFTVTNIDKDTEALNELEKFAAEKNLNIETLELDIREFIFEKMYDNIISFYLLHFLDRNFGDLLLQQIQNHTEVGGLNIIISFTDQGEFEMKDKDRFYLAGDYLIKKYKNWKILTSTKFTGLTKSGLQQEREVLVARKINQT